MKLDRRYVERPWGRTQLPPMFDPPEGKKIGEVWFTGAADLPLLVKYLFTGERLSVQVHPDDAQARARGLQRGKTECWYILDAEPGSTLGLGLKGEVAPEELKGAALDGSIEQLLDWRPVRAGDFYYVPAGTIHALGGGLALIEVQQNSDATYRLYDYGRDRELHLDDAVAAATSGHYPALFSRHIDEDGECSLVDGPHFELVLSSHDMFQDRLRWVMPLEGEVLSGRDIAGPGECLLLQANETMTSGGARMLIAATA